MNEKEETAPDISKGLIRICPHQTLSWERFHRIANLPDIKTADGFEALTKLPKNHAVIDTMRSWFAQAFAVMRLFGPAGHDVHSKNARECYLSKELGTHFLLTSLHPVWGNRRVWEDLRIYLVSGLDIWLLYTEHSQKVEAQV